MGVNVREKVKGSGVWWVFINHKGKRRSKKIGDKVTANRVAKDVREGLAKGDLGMTGEDAPTLADYGSNHLECETNEWSENTRGNYQGLFKNNVLPYSIAHKAIDQIKRKHIKGWIGQLKKKGLAKATIRLVVAVLGGMFESAVDDELIEINPCRKVGKFIGNGIVNGIVPYTAEEAQDIIDRALKLYGLTDHALFTVLLRTGIRIGEALALEWSDIDLEERTAQIVKNWDYKRKKMKPWPKNKKPREVDLSPATVKALKELKDFQGDEYQGAIFVSEAGDRLGHDLVTGHYEKIRPRDITLHGLRHTYATLRIAKGDNIVDVSNQLGHHDPGFTLKRYAHWMPRAHKAQVDELDNLHLTHPHRTLPVEKPTVMH
jgi:integrase